MEPTPKKAHSWPRHPDDWYVEPTWCSRRLFEEERFEGNVMDPACGHGRIVQAAQEAGLRAFGADIVKRSDLFCKYVHDFMDPKVPWWQGAGMDNIISNPPFKHCVDPDLTKNFVALALKRANYKVAMLLPETWHTADGRSRWIESTSLRRIYCITPRPSMPPGDWLMAGNKPGNGTKGFAWYVWLTGYDGPIETRWLRRDP